MPEFHAPRPYSWFADELVRALDALGLDQPALLVGHSFGCLIAQVFAAVYPDRVAGLVLAEASQPQLVLWDGDDGYQRDGSRLDATAIDIVRGAAEIVPLLPSWPSVILTRTPGRWLSPLATEEVDRRWRAAHAELASRLAAIHVIALDSGHAILQGAPSLIALAVDAVLRAEGPGEARLGVDAVEAAGGRLAVATSECRADPDHLNGVRDGRR